MNKVCKSIGLFAGLGAVALALAAVIVLAANLPARAYSFDQPLVLSNPPPLRYEPRNNQGWWELKPIHRPPSVSPLVQFKDFEFFRFGDPNLNGSVSITGRQKTLLLWKKNFP